jgi:hypothetical protein
VPYFPSLSRQNWPHDPQELDGFYGNPRGITGPNQAWEAANLVPFTYPWHEKGTQSYKIHKKVLPSLTRVLNAIWDYLGHDQAKITYYHLDETGGTFVFRQNRNASGSLSNHSYGIAIDLAPDENPNRAAWVDQAPPHLPRFVIEAFKQEGWRWGGDFQKTKDAMHFEAVFDMHHDQAPVPAPKPTDTLAPVTPLSPAQPPVVASVPSAMAPSFADGLENLVRMLILQRTGLPQELEHLKATTLPALMAARAQIDDAIKALTAFSIQDAPIIPGAPPPFPTQPPPPTQPPRPPTQTNIIATYFGGPNDRNTSAYDENHVIIAEEPGCALPWHFAVPLKIGARNSITGVTVHGIPTVDVGPIMRAWPTRHGDPYWRDGSRPAAETKKILSRAGIDFTIKTYNDLGLDMNAGHGQIDWWFESGNEPAVSTGGATGETKVSTQNVPAEVTVETKPALASKINQTQLAQLVTQAAALWLGQKFGLDAMTQGMLQAGLAMGLSGLTAIFKTWFTKTITPQSAAKV